ncbi:MAG TPA: hydrogenase expression/formation protein HypE, partial [Candidatus Altiarchaeales archaeon]|nr:hydrogenase expression/formation protein HypE [Candidatus Altiarchaeales archaeon]
MKSKKISQIHGGGGEAMNELLSEILSEIKNKSVKGGIGLKEMDDSATIPLGDKNIVFTTDSYTVRPLFFPGGDIGKLSICGTINDLAVMGAKPIAISTAFIIGDGFSLSDLKEIMKSINRISEETNTPVVTGDTKVIEDRIALVINTSGIGIADRIIKDSGLKVGDKIIINGTVGDHGIAILANRKGIEFETELESDCAPLYDLTRRILKYRIHAMKDPTRGGLANTLNEFAEKSNLGILIDDEKIPFRKEVKAASEMLGIDPLSVANEGKIVLSVGNDDAESVLKEMRKSRYGK